MALSVYVAKALWHLHIRYERWPEAADHGKCLVVVYIAYMWEKWRRNRRQISEVNVECVRRKALKLSDSAGSNQGGTGMDL